MEENLTQKSAAGNGADFTLQDRLNTINTYDAELVGIRKQIINRNLTKIESEGMKTTLGAALPSFVVLLISIFIDVSNVPIFGQVAQNFANWLFPGTTINQGVVPLQFWWLPFVVYAVFLLTAIACNRALKREVSTKGASEGAISRILDRYSGIVDALGTALPLIGAAILLISIKEGPTIFLGFSVPFEIKSIIILAIAKLFESVFDAQGLQYQELQEDLKRVENEYYYAKGENIQNSIISELKNSQKMMMAGGMNGGSVMKKEDYEEIYRVTKATADSVSTVAQKQQEISGAVKQNMDSIRAMVAEINSAKIMDPNVMKELNTISTMLNETINNMKDGTVTKSLDNLAYFAGRR
jgi:hypothetical protein